MTKFRIKTHGADADKGDEVDYSPDELIDEFFQSRKMNDNLIAS